MNEAFEEGFQKLKPYQNSSFIFDRDNGLHIKALHAWAAPINGVQVQAEWIANLIRIPTGRDNNKVLPDLLEETQFLQDLRIRFKLFDKLIGEGSNIERAFKKRAYKFKFSAFHGQFIDGVVSPINKKDTWWPQNLDAELVNTGTVHIFNVGAAGTTLEPRFPAVVENDKLQMTLNLLPRYDSYFSANVIPTDRLDIQQRTIVNGVKNYTSFPAFFSFATTQISELVSRLLLEPFPRHKDFDKYAVKEIGELINEKITEGDLPKAVQLADLFVDEFETQFKKYDVNDTRSFGGGSFHAARELSSLINETFDFVVKVITANPALESNLKTSNRSLEEFQARISKLITRNIADISDDFVKTASLNGLKQVVEKSSPKALQKAKTVPEISRISIEQYNNFNDGDRQIVGDILAVVSNRSDDLKNETLTTLNTTVEWLGRDVPLWSTIMNQQQITKVVDGLSSKQLPKKEPIKFVTDVIKFGGPKGNQRIFITETGKSTIKQLINLDNFVADTAIKKVVNAGAESPYSFRVQEDLAAELKQLNRNYLLQ